MKSKRTPARIQKLGYLTPDLGFPVRLVISDSEPEKSRWWVSVPNGLIWRYRFPSALEAREFRVTCRWYCAFPEIRDCAEPGKIPMKPVAIEDVNVMELGLGRSIYSPEQLEEFARFQESQGTRRAFLAESHRDTVMFLKTQIFQMTNWKFSNKNVNFSVKFYL